MSNREQFPWTRFGFEGVLIIVSILIAFSIEEWRQDRADAEQERILLEALAEDFEQAASVFDNERAAHARIAANGERIIHLADRGGVPESERTGFQRLVGSHFHRALFKPPMGTVETILGSGRIDLISNKQLLAELTQWSSVIATLNTLEVEARDHFYDRIYPYLATRVNLKDLDRGYREFYPDWPFEQQLVDVSRLLDDEEFIGIVYMHWVLKTNILTAMDPVEASLNRIRTVVAEELGES